MGSYICAPLDAFVFPPTHLSAAICVSCEGLLNVEKILVVSHKKHHDHHLSHEKNPDITFHGKSWLSNDGILISWGMNNYPHNGLFCSLLIYFVGDAAILLFTFRKNVLSQPPFFQGLRSVSKNSGHTWIPLPKYWIQTGHFTGEHPMALWGKQDVLLETVGCFTWKNTSWIAGVTISPTQTMHNLQRKSLKTRSGFAVFDTSKYRSHLMTPVLSRGIPVSKSYPTRLEWVPLTIPTNLMATKKSYTTPRKTNMSPKKGLFQ